MAVWTFGGQGIGITRDLWSLLVMPDLALVMPELALGILHWHFTLLVVGVTNNPDFKWKMQLLILYFNF